MSNKIEYMKFASDYRLIEQFLKKTSGCMTVVVDASTYGFNTYRWLMFEFYLGLDDSNNNPTVYMNIIEKTAKGDTLLNKYFVKPTVDFLNEVNKFIERLKDE